MGLADAFELLRDADWHDKSACQEEDPELFFSSEGEIGKDFTPAKKVCRRCPVAEKCLMYAIESNESYGVWGGLDPKERRRLKRDRRLRTKLREEAHERILREQEIGHVIRTTTRVIVRKRY